MKCTLTKRRGGIMFGFGRLTVSIGTVDIQHFRAFPRLEIGIIAKLARGIEYDARSTAAASLTYWTTWAIFGIMSLFTIHVMHYSKAIRKISKS